MAREPIKSGKSSLPHKPRGNNNSQTTSGNNNNVGRQAPANTTQKSASLIGMETWAKTTQDILQRRKVDIANTPRKDIADKAYNIYNRFALHDELRAVHKAHPDLSMNSSKLTGQQATTEMQQAVNNSGRRKVLSFVDKNDQHNISTDDTSYLHAHAKQGSKTRQKMNTNSKTATATGVSARFSLTSDAFFDEKNSGIYEKKGFMNKDGLKRKEEQQTEFGNLTAATLEWTKSERNATSAKVMGPGTLNKGRVDHAVLYASSIDNPKQKAQKYSGMMNHPSKRAPLGMEPMADGVAYGELITHTDGAFAPGYDTDNELLGTSRKELKSFGTNRANIIAAAIESHNQSGNKANLNENLRASIKAHGYRTSNPAKVNTYGSAYKKFERETKEHENGGPDKFARQEQQRAAAKAAAANNNTSGNTTTNHNVNNNHSNAARTQSAQMQSAQTQSTQMRSAANRN